MVQKKILTRQEQATAKKISVAGEESTVNIVGGVGTLALGKPGDIITRSYGPICRTARLAAETAFGAFVEGKGILVNPNDCAGLGVAPAEGANPFDTKKLQAGQLGTFLTAGACVVLNSQVAAIEAAMNVTYKEDGGSVNTDVTVIEVNGFASAEAESDDQA